MSMPSSSSISRSSSSSSVHVQTTMASSAKRRRLSSSPEHRTASVAEERLPRPQSGLFLQPLYANDDQKEEQSASSSSSASVHKVIPDLIAFGQSSTSSEWRVAKGASRAIYPKVSHREYDKQKYMNGLYIQDALFMQRTLPAAVNGPSKAPFCLRIGDGTLLQILTAEYLGKSRHSITYLARTKDGQTGVLKVFRAVENDPRAALRNKAKQLERYVEYRSRDDLSPFVATHLHFEPFLDVGRQLLGTLKNCTEEEKTGEFQKWVSHTPFSMAFIEHVPKPFPLEFESSAFGPWDQLRRLFLIAKEIPIDLRRSKVGMDQDGSVKFFSIFKLEEEDPATLIPGMVRTFSNDPEVWKFLTSRER